MYISTLSTQYTDLLQVTGWLVMPELVPQSVSSGSQRLSCGLQMAWDQHNMTLIAGGDYKVDHDTIPQF